MNQLTDQEIHERLYMLMTRRKQADRKFVTTNRIDLTMNFELTEIKN